MRSSAVSFLVSTQNQDGGWGYAPQQSSAVESTSAALLAIREDSSAIHARARAIAWLRSIQHNDGGWGFNSGDSESSWQTAWAMLALTRAGEAGDISAQGVKWLLSVKTLQISKDEMQKDKEISSNNSSLPGWPWLPGEATWIEPTALAMVALQRIPGITAGNERMKKALHYIQDRRCPGGGWNVGNPVMFDTPLPARAHPTAWVLLALSRLAPGNILPEDVKRLRSEMHRDGGALGLAWGLLALRALGEDDKLAERRLASMQGQNGGWENNPYITAVALMAMRGYL